MTDSDRRCLLCGDPQQPSEAMAESASRLTDHGVTLERMDWRATPPGPSSATSRWTWSRGARTTTTRAPSPSALDGVELLVVHKAPVSRAVFERGDDLEVVAAARAGSRTSTSTLRATTT